MAFKWDGFTFGVMGLAATKLLARLDGGRRFCLVADSVAQNWIYPIFFMTVAFIPFKVMAILPQTGKI